ncbi:MAG TPA: ornithine carbamoyltransferase [Pirellulaceae bacterium]|nr:ornithine carbamoyltransferase [Pirellulaceae bacterium]
MRHVLSILDLTAAEIQEIFAITTDLKAKLAQGVREALLPGRVAALLFEKPSLRTRVSFQTAMVHLGGGSLFLGEDVGWGHRESPADFSRVISEYVDVVVCRAKSHKKVEELARHATCPVINGLTDTDHPCQALADLFTLMEIHGSLKGKKVAFIGDANNVARSLAEACGMLGAEFVIAAPREYQFDASYIQHATKAVPGLKFTQTSDPAAAVKGACCVYTDVWASMGQESEQAKRMQAFAPYQVNAALMKHAPREAVFLHCLPARRGEEVTDEVIDGSQSAVVAEAGNRLHVQKGLLAWLLK